MYAGPVGAAERALVRASRFGLPRRLLPLSSAVIYCPRSCSLATLHPVIYGLYHRFALYEFGVNPRSGKANCTTGPAGPPVEVLLNAAADHELRTFSLWAVGSELSRRQRL